jgi:hypothetical protein
MPKCSASQCGVSDRAVPFCHGEVIGSGNLRRHVQKMLAELCGLSNLEDSGAGPAQCENQAILASVSVPLVSGEMRT